jgi:hypothetical protein
LAAEETVILDALLPKVLAVVPPLEEELDNVFVVSLLAREKNKESFTPSRSSKSAALTYPSGWSFIKNFLRLKESFRILAQEKVLIRVMP